MTGTFFTHKDTNPTQIDIVYRSEGKEFRVPAIVQVTASEMKLCHPEGEGGKRPDNFDPSPAVVVAIFEKQEDKAKVQPSSEN